MDRETNLFFELRWEHVAQFALLLGSGKQPCTATKGGEGAMPSLLPGKKCASISTEPELHRTTHYSASTQPAPRPASTQPLHPRRTHADPGAVRTLRLDHERHEVLVADLGRALQRGVQGVAQVQLGAVLARKHGHVLHHRAASLVRHQARARVAHPCVDTTTTRVDLEKKRSVQWRDKVRERSEPTPARETTCKPRKKKKKNHGNRNPTQRMC